MVKKFSLMLNAFMLLTILFLLIKPISTAPPSQRAKPRPLHPVLLRDTAQSKAFEKRVVKLSEEMESLTRAMSDLSVQLAQNVAPHKRNRLNMTQTTKGPEREALSPGTEDIRIDESFDQLSVAGIEHRFGRPDLATSSSQHFYKKGVAVQLDEYGIVDSVTFHGQYSSDSQDVNGNYTGLFQKDGAWYRPKRWKFKGLKVGDSITKILSRLGPCDESSADINGQRFLYYKSHKLTVKLSGSSHPKILGFRFGLPPQSDVNGNVGF